MNNLAQYDEQPQESNIDTVGYASDDVVHLSARSRERKRGKGDWRGISRNCVKTRTPTQVASHAQKYFRRRTNQNRRHRRSSLFDITTNTVPLVPILMFDYYLDKIGIPYLDITFEHEPGRLKQRTKFKWKIRDKYSCSFDDNKNQCMVLFSSNLLCRTPFVDSGIKMVKPKEFSTEALAGLEWDISKFIPDNPSAIVPDEAITYTNRMGKTKYDNNGNIVLVNNITNDEDYDKESTNTEISYQKELVDMETDEAGSQDAVSQDILSQLAQHRLLNNLPLCAKLVM
ncbi:hypothetical protein LXL04_023739 [Taraxacum kok-saghyz]